MKQAAFILPLLTLLCCTLVALRAYNYLPGQFYVSLQAIGESTEGCDKLTNFTFSAFVLKVGLEIYLFRRNSFQEIMSALVCWFWLAVLRTQTQNHSKRIYSEWVLKHGSLSLALNIYSFILCDQYNKRSKVSEDFLLEKNIEKAVTAVVGFLQWTSLLRTKEKYIFACIVMAWFVFVVNFGLAFLFLAFSSISHSGIECDAICIPWSIEKWACCECGRVFVVYSLQVRWQLGQWMQLGTAGDGGSKVTSEFLLPSSTMQPMAIGEQAPNAVREKFAALWI